MKIEEQTTLNEKFVELEKISPSDIPLPPADVDKECVIKEYVREYLDEMREQLMLMLVNYMLEEKRKYELREGHDENFME